MRIIQFIIKSVLLTKKKKEKETVKFVNLLNYWKVDLLKQIFQPLQSCWKQSMWSQNQTSHLIAHHQIYVSSWLSPEPQFLLLFLPEISNKTLRNLSAVQSLLGDICLITILESIIKWLSAITLFSFCLKENWER